LRANLHAKTINKVLFNNIVLDSRLHTDEAQHYKKPGKEFAKHERVNHSEGEYVRGDVTTNTVEGFFGIFKRGMTPEFRREVQHLSALSLLDFPFLGAAFASSKCSGRRRRGRGKSDLSLVSPSAPSVALRVRIHRPAFTSIAAKITCRRI
jgi:hypothetical protein